MLEKHTFLHINTDKPDKNLNPTECRSIVNMERGRDGHGVSDRLQLIQGTSFINNPDFQTGGTVVGTIEDREERKLYYFVKASGQHSIYELNGETEVIQLVVRWAGFEFSLDNPVSGVIVDGMLFFTDGVKPMWYVNVPFALDGGYTSKTEAAFAFNKPAALYTTYFLVPLPVGSPSTKRTLKDSYKFSHRIVYFDNSKSRLAHFSDIRLASLDWEEADPHLLSVTAHLPDIDLELIKEVEFILQRNNDANLEIFETVKVADITGTTAVAALNDSKQTIFLPASEVSQTFENIPRTSTTIELKDNRLFIAGGESGYDDNGIDLSLVLSLEPKAGGVTFLKSGGTYTVGISYEDKWGWRSPSLAESSISVPITDLASQGGSRLNVSIGGTPPLWAVTYHIMVREEAVYEIYQTFPIYLMYAVKEQLGGESTTDFTFIGEWQYRNRASTGQPPNYIHLKMPSNIPFVPEKGMKLRFRETAFIVDNPELDLEYIIEEIIGDKIQIDVGENASIWGVFPEDFYTVEVYRLKEVQSPIFNEIAVWDTCTNGVHDVTTKTWEGDQYQINTAFSKRLAFLFGFDSGIVPFDGSQEDTEERLYGVNFPQRVDDVVETPAHATGGEEAVIVSESTVNENTTGFFDLNSEFISERPVIKLAAYSLNYEQIDNDRSIFIQLEGETKLINNDGVVQYSDIYIQGSLVNGLFSFGLLSEYRLGVESGKIIRLEDVGENSILSIHPNTCNTLYIGRDVMKTGDDLDVIALTDNVVGYHRRLKSQFGTSHVGSIAEVDGNVYFFDEYRRSLIRYGNNGLVDLSEQGEMNKFFEDIINAQSLIGDSYRIRAGFYREHNQYFITFLGDTNYTVVYDDKMGKFPYYYTAHAEWLASFGSRLIMFKDANLYVWNEAMISLFFGENYSPSVTFIVNQQAELDYIFTNIVINSTKRWRLDIHTADGETYTYEDEFIEREKNKFYGDIYKDVSDRGAYPSGASPRFTGARLIGQTATVVLSRSDGQPVELTETLIRKQEQRGTLIQR